MKRILVILALVATTASVSAYHTERAAQERTCNRCENRERKTCSSCHGHWFRPFSCHNKCAE